jgi:hypothetical protein
VTGDIAVALSGICERALQSVGIRLPVAYCCLWALVGCASPPAAKSASTPMPPPSWQEAANASYAGALGAPVTLVDGLWHGAPYAEGGASAPRAGLTRDFLLSGDLDGDGAEETAVLIWTSTGGKNLTTCSCWTAARTVAVRRRRALSDRASTRAARRGGPRRAGYRAGGAG